MKVGILTFYKVQNFGANLQALSTFFALKKRGHEPVFIYYESEKMSFAFGRDSYESPQKKMHFEFVDKYLPQTELCRNVGDINIVIKKYSIESVIAGSDAILQHHPFFSRLRRGRRRPVFLTSVTPERMFPNAFWGCGICDEIPMAIMSASCQNSAYTQFSPWLKSKMSKVLSRIKYISVRDKWTQDMISSVCKDKEIVPLTPDPVFAFNSNAAEIIPAKEYILRKFSLPSKYILLCLDRQSISEDKLCKLNECFEEKGYSCVAFPMPGGVMFRHDFEFEIATPLCPLDWYAIIKHSSGYIGSNMHPIVVSLHNEVPCFSIDNWGTRDFWGRTKNDGSSKVKDILKIFNVPQNHVFIEGGVCDVDISTLVDAIIQFPVQQVKDKALIYTDVYNQMIDEICFKLLEN